MRVWSATRVETSAWVDRWTWSVIPVGGVQVAAVALPVAPASSTSRSLAPVVVILPSARLVVTAALPVVLTSMGVVGSTPR